MHTLMEQDRIWITVDVLPLSVHEKTIFILLSQRKAPPYQGMWALPGRFIRESESAEPAACASPAKMPRPGTSRPEKVPS